MSHYSFDAMGTTIEAWSHRPVAGSLIVAWFEEVERRCSRFRPESELNRINRDLSPEIPVSEIMWEVLTAADAARAMTGGLVDAGVGSAVSGWGYDRTFSEVADTEATPGEYARPDWSLNPDMRTLVRSRGTTLDLGGIAKGWACDRAVESGLANVVSAGGDLRSVDPSTITTLLDQHLGVAARVRVGIGALATSSITRRRWRAGGREVSHLIDPRTMEPVETPVLSATAIADTAACAETGAKAVLLRGVDGLAWAETQVWIRSAILLWHDGSVFATTGTEVAA